MMIKKKILLIGEIYSDNLGDAVLCEIVKRIILENINCDIELCDLSARKYYNRPFKYYFLENIIRKIGMVFYKYHLINLGKINVLFKNRYYKQFYKSYDLVIFAGGQMFMDYFVFPLEKILKFFYSKNIPVIFHACGAKEINDKNIVNRLRFILSLDNIKSISIRDSSNLVNHDYLLNSNMVAKDTFDTALNSKNYFRFNIHKDNIVGLGIMDWKKEKRKKLIDFWINIIDELDKRKIKWKLFCNGAIEDYNLLMDIVKIKDIDKKIYVQDRPITADDLVYNISSFKSIISFRLHSHIIAASMSIPSVGIIWDNKVLKFFSNIKMKNRCISINDSASDIIDLLENIEKENFNNDIIENQAAESKKLLIETIKNIF